MKGKQWQRYVDFCLSRCPNDELPVESFSKSWNFNISPLIWRIPIFLWSVSVAVWSAVSFWGTPLKFFLYMTHWGLLLIILESFFGIILAIKRPNSYDGVEALPWYVWVYWVLYNITIPVAFLVTTFYWGVLRSSVLGNGTLKYAPNPILDGMLHGGNAVAVSIELLLSAHRPRLAHVMQPLYFGLIYLLFTLAYYFAGGLDPWGNDFIYPMLSWSRPWRTVAVVAATAILLAGLHAASVIITRLRDKLASSSVQTPCNEYEA